jgi:hypothetical protein
MGAINFIEVVRGCDSPEDAYKEDAECINETLNDAMEYLADLPEETCDRWLFHRISDVFELLNK